MARIRHVLEKHTEKHGVEPEGVVEKVNQVIMDEDARAPEPEPAPEFSIRDMMPLGEKQETDKNPEMIANHSVKRNCIDFVLIQDVKTIMANGKAKGLCLPSRQNFDDLVGEALNALVDEDMNWCNVVAGAWFNRHEIGVIQINYGYRAGAERFRQLLTYLSTEEIIYNTYPAANLLKKYAITVHIHSGFRKIKTRNLGPCLLYTSPSPRDRQKSRMPSSA